MLCHPTDPDLELFYLAHLSPEQMASVETHVAACEECRDKLRAFEDVSVCPLDVFAAGLAGRVVTISKDEIKLELSERLQPGMLIQARIGTRIILAQVRYCSPNAEKFHLSCEIKNVYVIPIGPAK